MKKNYIARLLVGAFLATIGFASCKSKTEKQTEAHQHNGIAQQYTCPMHPQIVEDEPGSCPICGMDLVEKNGPASQEVIDSSLTYLMKPVNEQVIASVPVIKAKQTLQAYTAKAQGTITYDTRNKRTIASRVGGRIERLLIKYNYQPVKKGQLIMEIYSPDLAAAQRELLFIKKTGNEEGMLDGARQRLMLLGMNAPEIDRVLRTGKISYRVPIYSNASGFILEQSAAVAPGTTTSMVNSSGSSGGMNSMEERSSGSNARSTIISKPASPILIREGEYVAAGQSLFTIYQTGSLVAEFALQASDAGQISKNSKVLISKTNDTSETYTGNIGLIQPQFNEGENFTIARVYLESAPFVIGELVTAEIPLKADKGLWLPKEAMVFLGNKTIVLKKENKVFIPKEVSVGVTANGQIQVLDDISGWEIASNAQYLIDSESFIKIKNDIK